MYKQHKLTTISILFLVTLFFGVSSQSALAYHMSNYEKYNEGYQEGADSCNRGIDQTFAFIYSDDFRYHSFPYKQGYLHAAGLNGCTRSLQIQYTQDHGLPIPVDLQNNQGQSSVQNAVNTPHITCYGNCYLSGSGNQALTSGQSQTAYNSNGNGNPYDP